VYLVIWWVGFGIVFEDGFGWKSIGNGMDRRF